MPFKQGEGGRQVGSLNKRSKDFISVLEKHNFCPATALVECYRDAKRVYDSYGIIYDAIVEAKEEQCREKGYQAVPPEDNAHKYLKIAADIAKDLSGYAYPKLKAIEQTKDDALAGMSPEQRLEAMKHAVQMLELQIKRGNGPGVS